MILEGLDCWDDYPYEHGCICGNDCPPPCGPAMQSYSQGYDEATNRTENA